MKAAQISMATATEWPLDTNIAPGGSPDPWPVCFFVFEVSSFGKPVQSNVTNSSENLLEQSVHYGVCSNMKIDD